MSKSSRSGGKYSGSHTTLIPAAAFVCDLIEPCEAVTKITIGFIKPGLRPAGGNKRIKVTKNDSVIHVAVRGNISQQEFFVYPGNSFEDVIQIIRSRLKKKKGTNFSLQIQN